ncbi:MAG: MFS transporter [Nitrospirota bacterium]|nr:MFS transporter [Nitrospirota bacterium]
MLGTVTIIFSLLLGMAALLMGVGLMGTTLGLRAAVEGFSPGVTGVVMSAYFVGYVIGTRWCPGMIRRVGHIRAFAAMASVASTAILCHSMLVTPVVWTVLRVITGTCMVGLYLSVESWLNALASNTNRGRLFAVYQIVCLSALAVGQFLVLAGDVAGFVPFVLSSLLISLSLVPVALTTVEQPAAVPGSGAVALKHLVRLSPSAMGGALGSGLLNGTLWGMGPLFAHLAGRDEMGVASFMAVLILGGALLQWPVGWLSDRMDRRLVLAGVGVCGAVCAVAVAATATAPLPWLLGTAFFYGGMAFSVYGLSVAHMNDMVEPHHALEAARGIMLLHGVGAMIGPIVGGLLMGALGPGALMGFMAVVLALVGGFCLLRRVARKRSGAGQTGFVPMLRTTQAAFEMDPRMEEEPEKQSS